MREVLDVLEGHKIIISPKKVQLFMTKVEFCGHVLHEGKRYPAPGKLMALQKWELPQTVTQLRAFLGVVNYYSSYVPNHAAMTGPLSSKLQLNRVEGKKGATKTLSLESFRKRGL